MSAHTPGPWRYEYEHGYCGEIIGRNGRVVCAFIEEPIVEDARLIAAAPDLLEALIGFVADADEYEARTRKTIRGSFLNNARAAIAKATGETKTVEHIPSRDCW